MTNESYNQEVAKVSWWKSSTFRIGLAIFIGLATIAVVLFNQQISTLLQSLTTKATTQATITLDGNSQNDKSYFLGAGFSAKPNQNSFKVENGKLMLNPNATLTPRSGLVLGDSTVATSHGGTQIVDFLYTPSEISAGWTVTSIARKGDTISKQKDVYLTTSNRSEVDYTLVQIGLNDLKWDEASGPAIARLQDLINTINSNKKSGSLTIVSTMTPNRQRLIDAYGESNGAISYQKYLDINNAIKGLGATPITGVNARISNHTTLLSDGNGNLAAQYETSYNDHIHENNLARQLIAQEWRKVLTQLHML